MIGAKLAIAATPKRRNFSAIRRLIGQRWHGVPHRHRAGVQARGNGLICGDGDLSKIDRIVRLMRAMSMSQGWQMKKILTLGFLLLGLQPLSAQPLPFYDLSYYDSAKCIKEKLIALQRTH